MSRELTSSEQNLAELLCDERWAHDEDHCEPLTGETACPACRADVVRLVDGEACNCPAKNVLYYKTCPCSHAQQARTDTQPEKR